MLTLVSCIVRVSIQWVTVLIQPKYVPAAGRDRSGGAGVCYWSTIKLQTSPSPTITSKGAPSDVVGGTLLLPSSFIVLMVEESRFFKKMLFLLLLNLNPSPVHCEADVWVCLCLVCILFPPSCPCQTKPGPSSLTVMCEWRSSKSMVKLFQTSIFNVWLFLNVSPILNVCDAAAVTSDIAFVFVYVTD